MFEWIRIFGRHEVDRWRDEQTLDAAAILNEVAAELTCMFEEEIKAATWRDALVSPRAFIATKVAPAVRAAAEAVVLKMIERANRDLRAIVEHQAVWNSIPREQAIVAPDLKTPLGALGKGISFPRELQSSDGMGHIVAADAFGGKSTRVQFGFSPLLSDCCNA